MADQDDEDGYLLERDSVVALRRVRQWFDSQPKNRLRGFSAPGRGLTEWVQIYNDSGANIAAHSVVAVTGGTDVGTTLSEDTKSSPLYKIGLPSTTFRRMYLIVGPDPDGIDDKCIGWAIRSGPCWALYDSGTPAYDEFFGPKPSQNTLSKGYIGNAAVLSIIDTTAKILACDWTHRVTTVLCKTDGAVTAGASTTAYDIYAGTLGSEASTFTTVPTAWSRTAIASGKWCMLIQLGSGFELTPLEC